MSTKNQQDNTIGGPYMVQDLDHMVVSNQPASKAKRGGASQAEQSQSASRQHGGDHASTRQRRQAQ
jgi:hypothetical protein